MTDINLPAERGPDSMSLAASAGIGFGGASGFDLAPKSLGEVVGFSKLMASSGHAIPGHLRGNPGACMAVTIQALGWKMSPFAVAQKSYKVGDTIAYEAQLITAVVNARAGFKNRPLVEFIGEGDSRQCRVTFTFRNGDVRDYLSPKVSDIKVKNSPLWKNDPDQQLSYFSQRSAARRHCPEVILGVYDPDELEHAEPMRQVEGPARPAPTSLRARIADGAKSPGFDPNHVAAETGGGAAADVIEAVATPTSIRPGGRDQEAIERGEQAEPGAVGQAMAEAIRNGEEPAEPRTEGEQKDQLAAALASLDKKPVETPADATLTEALEATGAEVVEVQAEAAEEVAAEVEGADDLIVTTAYDDGYAGDPVEPVLSMCEDEREEAVAREAHARGVADRIAKEAEEHAASEADTQARAQEQERAAAAAAETAPDAPEIADVAGPAPAGEKYLLGTEEPAADGKLNLYQDGEVFSRVEASKAAGKYSRYDGHPQPADPALASQGDGVQTKAEEPAPPAEPATDTPNLQPSGQNGLYKELAAKDSWLQIKPLLTELYGSAIFKGLSPEEQAATRANLFGAVLEMKERTRDPVDWASDAAAFGLWIDWMAAGSDSASDKLDAISGTFQTLQGGKMWKDRLTDAQRTALEARVAGVLAKIRGA